MRWIVFGLLFVVSVVNFIDRGSLAVAMPLLGHQLRLSPSEEGFLLSAFAISYLAMQVPGAWLLDRVPARALLTVTSVLWAVVQGATGFVGSALALGAARLGLGVAEGPFYPVSGKLIGSWLAPRERPLGAQLVNSGATLGNAVGAIIMTTLIVTLGGWRPAFVATGVIGLVVAAAIWAVVRNRPHEHRRVNGAELEHITAAATDRPAEEPLATVRFTSLARRGTFWWLCTGWFCYGVVFFGLMTWGPQYLAEAHGFKLTSIGWSTLAIFGTGAVGSLTGGVVAGRWQARGARRARVLRSLFTVSGAATAVGLILVTVISTPLLAVLLLAAVLFFQQWQSMYWSLPGSLSDPHSSGRVGSAMNVGSQVGAVVSPIVVGFLVQWTGSFTLAMYFFVACAILFIVASLAIRYDARLADPPDDTARERMAVGAD